MISAEQFTASYALHHGRLESFLLRKGAHGAEVEEFTQAAWARAWEKREQYSGGSFFGWMCTIAVRLFWESLRRQRGVELWANNTSYTESFDDQLTLESVLLLCKPKVAQLLSTHYLEDALPRPISLKVRLRICRALKHAHSVATKKAA